MSRILILYSQGEPMVPPYPLLSWRTVDFLELPWVLHFCFVDPILHNKEGVRGNHRFPLTQKRVEIEEN